MRRTSSNTRFETEQGTPQGGVISPVLANRSDVMNTPIQSH